MANKLKIGDEVKATLVMKGMVTDMCDYCGEMVYVVDTVHDGINIFFGEKEIKKVKLKKCKEPIIVPEMWTVQNTIEIAVRMLKGARRKTNRMLKQEKSLEEFIKSVFAE
ncbi:MAG: hypothetical protein RR338_01130 [Clostridia bacterium]